MKKFAIFCAICLLTFSGSALAQPSYLIRIDQVNNMTIQQIERAEIEVYAKTADFWIAGDANHDGEVGPRDVVYLINYLFRNGPPPSRWALLGRFCLRTY